MVLGDMEGSYSFRNKPTVDISLMDVTDNAVNVEPGGWWVVDGELKCWHSGRKIDQSFASARMTLPLAVLLFQT